MKTRLIMAVLVLMGGLLVLASQCTNDNVRPVALFTADQVEGLSPLTVNFDGSGSYDPDGTIESYSWNFGDGASGTGVTTGHTFTATSDKAYTVRLTVTDDGGKSATTTATISVTGSDNGATLFFDDFENGFATGWVATNGWYFTDGVLRSSNSSIGDFDWAYVSVGKGWSDYAVEVDVHPGSAEVGIVVRCSQDLQSYVLIVGSGDSLSWRVVGDGEIIAQGNSIHPGFFAQIQHVKVVLHGSSYSLYVNDLLRVEFIHALLSRGMPGLAGSGSIGGTQPRFDDFRVTALE